jgi:hypothetical protein
MIFDRGHEVRGPYWVFTNLAVETGIMTDFYRQIIVSAMASPTGSLFSAIVRCSLRLR